MYHYDTPSNERRKNIPPESSHDIASFIDERKRSIHPNAE